MNVPPILHRELLVQSRRKDTWRLRMVFALGTGLALVCALLLPNLSPAERGKMVLVAMTLPGFVLCLFLGAYLTADVLSAEKRDGTLGLLLLTHLNAWKIILGKMLCHALQTSYALLAMFPIFFIPVLVGGVTWGEVIRLLIVLLVTLLLSLACGMFWSAILSEARSAVLSTFLTLLGIALLPWLLPTLGSIATSSRVTLHAGFSQVSPLTAFVFAFEGPYRQGSELYLRAIVGCLAITVILILAAGLLLPRSWLHEGHGHRNPGRKRVSDFQSAPAPYRPKRRSPRWASRPGRAPLLWLASRDLREPVFMKATLAAGVLFFAMMILTSVKVRHGSGANALGLAILSAYLLHFLVRVQIAMAATRRWVEDHRSGALETLLATPINDFELLHAHHHALKRAFRGSLLMLLSLNATLIVASLVVFEDIEEPLALLIVLFLGGAVITVSDFVTLRWLGIREALRHPTPMKAAGRSLGILLALSWPGFLVAILLTAASDGHGGPAAFFLWCVFCLLFNRALVLSARQWLQAGIRVRATELSGT